MKIEIEIADHDIPECLEALRQMPAWLDTAIGTIGRAVKAGFEKAGIPVDRKALVHLSVESQSLTGAQMQALIDAALRLGDAGFLVEMDAAEEEKLRHANRWTH